MFRLNKLYKIYYFIELQKLKKRIIFVITDLQLLKKPLQKQHAKTIHICNFVSPISRALQAFYYEKLQKSALFLAPQQG